MKKFISRLTVCVLALSMLLIPAGCAQKTQPKTERAQTITAESIDRNLRSFLGTSVAIPDGDRGTRAFASPSEKAAAEFLEKKFSDAAVYSKLKTRLYEIPFTVQATELVTHNVVVRYDSVSSDKLVVIGTHIDNAFGTRTDDVGKTSLGAGENGTGVAALMSLIDYVAATDKNFGVDLAFVFFGAGSINSVGSSYFLNKTLTGVERKNTQLMVNLYRFGGDSLYLYSDEVKTPSGEYLVAKSDSLGLGVNRVPKTMPIINQSYVPRIPYTHYAMLGNHAPFMEEYIPVANLFGANLGSFNLSDIEHWGDANLGTTSQDTYTNLLRKRPQYAAQAANAVTLLAESLIDDAFFSALTEGSEHMPSYDSAVQRIWMYVGVIGLIVVLAVLLILLVKHFEKKYPYEPPVRKLKIAVFGGEYETKTEGDIFVDIKKPRDPFSGY